VKFCPECGSQPPLGPAKFCPNCGKSLSDLAQSNIFEQKDPSDSGQPDIYSLGVKLEQMVEQIMKNKQLQSIFSIGARIYSALPEDLKNLMTQFPTCIYILRIWQSLRCI